MPDPHRMREHPEEEALRSRLSSIEVPAPPPLGAVIAKGRQLRRRRLSRTAGLPVLAAAVAALVFGPLGPFARPPGHRTASRAVIRTASFILVRHENGSASLTINPKELFDPVALQSALAEYGIAAMVTSDSFCSSSPAPGGFNNVVSTQPRGPFTAQAGTGDQPTLTFDPSAMPAGTELSLGNFTLGSGQEIAYLELISTSSYSCVSTPPELGPSTPGLAIEYGGAAGTSGDSGTAASGSAG